MQKDFISVAMATYNGEKYIKKQIESILYQLNDDDEIVVSDDGSTDKTIEIIKKINDKRIKLIKGPQLGIKQNFANAIVNCNGKYIFLSDQDDIWEKGKLKIVISAFKNDDKINCVVHDCIVVDNDEKILLESFYEYRNSKHGVLKNIIKNSYIGCCMAFKKDVIDKILPIPDKIEMHDQWIGLVCEKYGKSIFINDKLIKYRRHESNFSKMSHYPISKMIKNRINLIFKLKSR